jgi:hypothetical protein
MGKTTRELPGCSEIHQHNAEHRTYPHHPSPSYKLPLNLYSDTQCGKHSWQLVGILEAAAAAYKVYSVIRTECQGFNNLTYAIYLR